MNEFVRRRLPLFTLLSSILTAATALTTVGAYALRGATFALVPLGSGAVLTVAAVTVLALATHDFP